MAEGAGPRRDRPGQRIGCYPGSFDPPTIAHLAVVEAAVDAARLDRIDLVLSSVALGKEAADGPTPEQRAEVLRAVAATRPWLGVALTDAQLVADIAAGYDAVVMGADKWRQVIDPAWYPSPAERDRAIAALPEALVVPRAGDRPEGVRLIDIDTAHAHVSATAARQGATHLALPEAIASGLWPSPETQRRDIT